MKNLLKHKIVFGIVVSLLAIAAFSGIVYAAVSAEIPGQVSIVAATNDIKIFSDPACKYEIKSLTWSDLPVGGEKNKRVYILNVGNTDAEVTATLNGAPAGLTLQEGSNKVTVPSGQSAGFELILDASQTASVAAVSFSVNFTCAPVFVNP